MNLLHIRPTRLLSVLLGTCKRPSEVFYDRLVFWFFFFGFLGASMICFKLFCVLVLDLSLCFFFPKKIYIYIKKILNVPDVCSY